MKKYILAIFMFSFASCSYSQLKDSQVIDDIFSEWDASDVPGCALGIIKDKELIYARGYGLANMEYGIPNSPSTVFRIASTSKQFTAACIVLLAEQNALQLDDNLKSIFPDFPDYAAKITIRHLLTHTSGIRDYLQLSYLKGLRDDDYYKDSDIMNWLINQTDLNFAPGDEHLYSNSGYWILGQIVKKVSGMNMAEFAKQELFDPLGMNDTHFHNDHSQIVKNRASGYAPAANDTYRMSMTTLDMIGDGGIFTTIEDIKKWDDAYYDSDVLSKKFWSMMTQQGELNNGEVIDYASGLMISEYKGLKTVRHGGAFVGFRAELLRFPNQKLSIAIFTNRADAYPSRMANQIADILLKDKLMEDQASTLDMPLAEIPVQEIPIDQMTGNYEIEAGVIVNLSIKDDSLHVLQTWNDASYNIARKSGNTFQIPGEDNIGFIFSNLKEEETQTLTVMQGTNETVAKRRKEFDASGINLADYTGQFYSKELDVNYNFEIDNDQLIFRLGNSQSTSECRINDTDHFLMDFGLVRFQRENGVVSGFELDSGRVKNVVFEKK